MHTLSRLVGVFLVLGVFVASLSQAANGQAVGRLEDVKSTVAYFYHAEPGEATVQVSVWGSTARPGIYEVPVDTDLDLLLTMAGGAPIGEQQEGREPAKVTIRVYRPSEEGAQRLLFERRVEDLLTDQISYPTFRDGDIVVVETIKPRQRFTWRDAISVLSSLGTLTLLALRIFDRR